jgi:rhamnulose-1-phosphate aldolase
MQEKHTPFLAEIIKTSHDIWEKGWAERNAGNISVRMKPEEVEKADSFHFTSEWQALNKTLPNLASEFFLVSGTGRYIRNIPVAPEKNLGIIEINETGDKYRIVWGYTSGGKPTSELPAHLQAHSVRKELTNGVDRAIIHTHPTNIIALTYAMDLDTCSLSRLLWEMHAECIVVFPEGVEFLPWMMAGSQQIADATAEAFQKRNMVIWQFHGIFATGRNLDTAFGLIDTAEKSAEIYLKAAALGPIKNKFTLDQLNAIARNFGQVPAPDIFEKLK